MADASHNFGEDIILSATGDIATVEGSHATKQRVLRRLLTNPGAYIWNLNYGAGLGGFVGKTNPGARVRGIVRQQMRLEAAVANNPAPSVAVNPDINGILTVNVQFTDAATKQPSTLTVPVG